MKKMIVLGMVVVLAVCLGFTACDLKGGTLKLINDTSSPHSFSIYFDGRSVRVNDGQTTIQPSQTISATSDENTSYVVYRGSAVLWTGTLSGGETIELRYSTAP
ncbi:MAG: hypothetical protein LBH43_05460 [Treponema sp.]|jgi:hypothetical protein|nr:hypothetical protein [Treponema sp.]